MRYLFILLLLIGCKNNCEITDNSFRPHKVRHCNKSKQYWYYHNKPCDCPGINEDLYHNYQQTYKNYLIFYNDNSILYEK
jgi:hypothetical protein